VIFLNTNAIHFSELRGQIPEIEVYFKLAQNGFGATYQPFPI